MLPGQGYFLWSHESAPTLQEPRRWVQAALAAAPSVMWEDKTVDKMCHNDGAVTNEIQIVLSVDGSATCSLNSIVFLNACMLLFFLFKQKFITIYSFWSQVLGAKQTIY